MRIPIEVSPGEAFDKLSILEIKLERISDQAKLAHVERERRMLRSRLGSALIGDATLAPLLAELRRVNEELWEIEDRLRLLERDTDFGDDFVALARSVYRTNDRRAEIKRELDRILGSDIAEQKSYVA